MVQDGPRLLAQPPHKHEQRRELDPARLGDHIDRLYRVARALTGSAHEAEDLVQETYLRVLARPRHLRSQSDVGYLMSALRHTFIEHRRRRRAETVPLDDLVYDVPDASSATRPERAAAAREVFAAIAALPDGHREVVTAVDVAGLSYREAADVLDVPVGTIMSRLYRARGQLAVRLGDAPG
jgi:RNA polymerase sigma-70 factor, ECF subfamily